MATSSSLKVTLQPSDWVRAGLARLAADGIDSVRVEVLARDLHVSKGSFYWHFHDREELLSRILSRWEADDHSRLDCGGERTAAQRWASFIEQTSAPQRLRLELSLRAWAHKDPKVAIAIARADGEKMRFIADVLREIGFENARAESWAEIMLLVWLGWLDRAANDTASGPGCSGLSDILCSLILAASGQQAT